MNKTVMTYLGFAFVLILVFLITTQGQAFKNVLNALGSANVGAIRAFQGRPSGAFVS